MHIDTVINLCFQDEKEAIRSLDLLYRRVEVCFCSYYNKHLPTSITFCCEFCKLVLYFLYMPKELRKKLFYNQGVSLD